jgi:hypothetical protein
MSLFQWANARIQKLTVMDMAFTKMSVMAFALTVAKLWPTILGLDWYWYAGAWLIFAIRPIYRFFKN